MISYYQIYFYVLAFTCVAVAFPTGYHGTDYSQEERRGNDIPRATQEVKQTTPLVGYYFHNDNAAHQLATNVAKKSDMPEKGQIKFMKTLLGKVKTLLNNKKHDSSTEDQKEEKISPLSSNNGKLYGIVGDKAGTTEEDGGTEGKHEKDIEDKSVNVISIPVKALTKMSRGVSKEHSAPTLVTLPGQQQGAPALQGSANSLGLNPFTVNNGVTSFVPVLLQPGQGPGNLVFMNPQAGVAAGNEEQAEQTLPRLIIQRHGNIEKHDDSLYRDIGHIPGEAKFHDDVNQPDRTARFHGGVTQTEETGRTSLRHKQPGARRPNKGYDRYDDDDEDDDDDDDDDDDYDDDDYDDDDEDEDDPTSQRMRAEQREIDATSKKLYGMLPGNDPTYTSENRGLPLMRPYQLQKLPEAFLGNPMLGGKGFENDQAPFASSALLGEHADNSNDRGALLLGGNGQQRFYDGDTTSQMSQRYNKAWNMNPTTVSDNGFNLGGSNAQALSSNEVDYLVQKSPGSSNFNQLLQKNKIPHNVLLEVNGQPIGDSRELRSHIVNGRVMKGKEKLIKSKGPIDVKISKATDGVHSKVVNITSSNKDVKVLEAKSNIAKHRN